MHCATQENTNTLNTICSTNGRAENLTSVPSGKGGGAENAGVKNAGATKYGKPSEENILKYQTNICRGFPRPNLFVFLGYMQYITFDSVSDVSRVTRGLAIRRAKKRVNLTNDKRIKMCLQRLDSHE